MRNMTAKQRELTSKYLSDMSKGLLLAVAIGFGTSKLSLVFAFIYTILAVYCFVAAYWMEGRDEYSNTQQ